MNAPTWLRRVTNGVRTQVQGGNAVLRAASDVRSRVRTELLADDATPGQAAEPGARTVREEQS